MTGRDRTALHEQGVSSAKGVPTCRSCGARNARLRARLTGYSVWRCRQCGLVFSDLPDSELAGLYDESYYREEFGPYFAALFGEADDTLLRERFAEYLEAVETHVRPGRLLDVGCASGLFLDVARERGWRVKGAEISEYAARVARERFGLDVAVGDIDDLELPEAAFHVVAMLDMLEHSPDPAATLAKVAPLIAPGGLLLLVLPNDRNLVTWIAMALYRMSAGAIRFAAEGVHQIYHLSYFTPETITELLEGCDFEVLEIRPDETVLGLVNESPIVRCALKTIFWLARLIRAQNKMLVIARPVR